MARSCLEKVVILMRGGDINWHRTGVVGGVVRTGLEDVTEARVAEDERRRRTRVEDSIENSGSNTATDKPYQCSVCERAFRRKQDIDRHGCVRNINNCDLVCHLWQRSIIRWVASFQGQAVCVCVCVLAGCPDSHLHAPNNFGSYDVLPISTEQMIPV